MTWPRLLTVILWISPHALLAVVAILMGQRRLHRDFPFFLLYTVYELVAFLLLYTLNAVPSITGQQYMDAFLATLLISITLRFGVIKEITEDLFREHQFLKVAATRSLRWTKVVLVLVGIACAAYVPGENGMRLMGGLTVISRGVAIVQCGLLLYLLCFSRLLGLSWRTYAFGIALGLGILSSVDLATSALRAFLTGDAWVRALNLITTGSYLISASVWLGYLLAPSRKPSSFPNLSRKEVENWNQELQRWLQP